MTDSTAPQDNGLRQGVMTEPELMAQAIASIAPSAVMAFTAMTIYAGAGNGTLMSLLLATIVILCVGYTVTVFAKRHTSAGSLYTYVAKGLGPFFAYMAGVTLLIGSWGIAAGSLGGAVNYASEFLGLFDLTVEAPVGLILLTILIGSAACLFTIWGVRISAQVSLILELLSVAIILTLFVVALIALGDRAWQPEILSMEGVEFQGVAVGMVLGILGFVGFSSADALGREAKNPRRAIPRAIMWSASAVGVIYIFSAYAQIAVLGEGLATSANPLSEISTKAAMPDWFAPILTFGVAASFFAVVVAPLNVVSRIFYVMGKEGVAPQPFGRTHSKFLTPHRSILLFGPLAILLDIVLLLNNVNPMDITVWVDTFGTYGYMVAYLLVAVACVAYTTKHNIPNTLVWITASVAVVSMVYVFYVNIWPVPDFPLNIIPYVFFGIIAVTVCWYGYLMWSRPDVKRNIGNIETESMEGIG